MPSSEVKRIAFDRIRRLMEFARRHAAERPELAREAILLAMRVARKARIKIPREYRRTFCRRCGTSFYTPGSFTVRVRDRRSTHVVVRCNVCGYVRRIPAVREKRKMREAE